MSAEQQHHDIGWAVSQMNQGKAVRRKSWRNSAYHLFFEKEQLSAADNSGKCAYEDNDPKQRTDDLLATDWELYEPEEPGHDFNWALEQINAGCTVKRLAWVAHCGDCGMNKSGRYGARAVPPFEMHDAYSIDWVLA